MTTIVGPRVMTGSSHVAVPTQRKSHLEHLRDLRSFLSRDESLVLPGFQASLPEGPLGLVLELLLTRVSLEYVDSQSVATQFSFILLYSQWWILLSNLLIFSLRLSMALSSPFSLLVRLLQVAFLSKASSSMKSVK